MKLLCKIFGCNPEPSWQKLDYSNWQEGVLKPKSGYQMTGFICRRCHQFSQTGLDEGTPFVVQNIRIMDDGSIRTADASGSRDKKGNCLVTTGCAGGRKDVDCPQGNKCPCVCHLLDKTNGDLVK